MNISLSDATAIVDRAISRADAMGVPMNIAVVDGGGHLIAFARMDKAILGSIDIALAKAKTSILFNGPSENLWEYCNPGGPALVLEAFDTLFDKRDYATAEKFWSEDYVQHSSRIPPGRDGLFEVIKSRPPEFAYEPELIVAENDLVMIWGRFSGHGAGLPWDRREHHSHRGWASEGALGRIEDEVTRANSLSGLPMFGDTFPEER